MFSSLVHLFSEPGDRMPRLWQDFNLTDVFSFANLAGLSVFVVVFCVLQRYQRQKKDSNIPPGPKPWPIVGNFGGFLVPSFILRRFVNREELAKTASNPLSPQDGLTELSKIYGDIFSIFVGPQLMVVLTGYDVVRDALSNHAEVFSDRPEISLITIITKRKGKVTSPYKSF